MRPGLDGAQAGLPCAPPRRKKNAAATGRGRGGSRSPVVRHTAQSKRPLDQQRSAATYGGRGGAQPPHGTPAHASPSRHERAPYPLHAQCLRPRSTDGQDRTPPWRCRDCTADYQGVGKPLVMAGTGGASAPAPQHRLRCQGRARQRRRQDASTNTWGHPGGQQGGAARRRTCLSTLPRRRGDGTSPGSPAGSRGNPIATGSQPLH